MEIMGRNFTYIIEGNLAAFSRMDMDKKRIWDATSTFRAKSSIQLESQHGDRPKFTGPLHVDCVFFLEYPGPRSVGRKLKGNYHLVKPYMSVLMYFLEHIGIDILFDEGSSISSVTSKKLYDTRARTEFTVYEIRGAQ
jgi:hypothetical protein